MTIDAPLNFGKYKGFTIEQIFSGSNSIDRAIFKAFFSESISSPIFLSHIDIKDLELIDTSNFNITNEYIYVYPENDELIADQSFAISRLFRVRDTVAERKKGFISINSYIIGINSKRQEKIYSLSGHPQYIEWCINNIDAFFITPDNLKKLHEATIYQYIGIDVKFKNLNAYEYTPKYFPSKYLFDNETLINNLRKYNQFISAKNAKMSASSIDNERHSFEQFKNSYAQDVEGWSDQDINDAFGGQADAYWNID